MTTEPICVQDIENLARKKLEKKNLIYIESGAGEQHTLKENCRAFQRIKLRPRVLRGITDTHLSTTILGQPISMPICIAPAGVQKLAHPDGELATVRAAASHHTCMALSYWANTSVEDIADAAPSCLRWCAVKFADDRNFVKQLVRRAENTGYTAVVVTLDSQVPAKRFDVLRNDTPLINDIPYPNLKPPGSADCMFPNHNSRRAVFGKATNEWDDIKWLKSLTKLPVVLKGILTAEDARMAVEYGADGIMVSNHGARQLDGVPATIEVLPEIVDAVEGKIEVYLDGGVRLGTDVFKAVALGARAVFIGRPVFWGLAWQGEDGVKKVLELLREDLRTTMILSGCAKLTDITRHHVNISTFSRL